MILKDSMKLVLVGLAVGMTAALALTRLLQWLLFGVGAHDPATLAAVAIVLVGTGMLAGLVPALGGTRIDPNRALRYE